MVGDLRIAHVKAAACNAEGHMSASIQPVCAWPSDAMYLVQYDRSCLVCAINQAVRVHADLRKFDALHFPSILLESNELYIVPGVLALALQDCVVHMALADPDRQLILLEHASETSLQNQYIKTKGWTGRTYIVAVGVNASIKVISFEADKVAQLSGISPGINKSSPEVSWRGNLIHICCGHICNSLNRDLHQLAI